MSINIQAGHRSQAYSAPAKPKKTGGAVRQAGGFPGLAAQGAKPRADVMETSRGAQSAAKAEDAPLQPELSEAEEMQLFQKEFYEDLAKLTNHPSISSAAVNISDAAFQAMKADPEYREKILSLLQRDLGASVAPRSCSLLITVGATLEEYRGDSWPAGNDSEFRLRSKDSFYTRSSEAQSRQKEFLQEYQEKKVQAKRQRQRLLEEAAADRRKDLEHIMQEKAQETSFSGIAALLKARAAAVPGVLPAKGRKE